MEGVVFALRQGLELMLGLGTPAERIIVSGGAARHPLWLQLQADILKRPIHRTETTEAAALGAAMLAGVGAGVYPDALAACRQVVRWRDEVVMPDPARTAQYDEAYSLFCALYPALLALRQDSASRGT